MSDITEHDPSPDISNTQPSNPPVPGNGHSDNIVESSVLAKKDRFGDNFKVITQPLAAYFTKAPTVSNMILKEPDPPAVAPFLQIGSQSFLGQVADIDDRNAAFRNGIKLMAEEGPQSKWTKKLDNAAMNLFLRERQTFPPTTNAAQSTPRKKQPSGEELFAQLFQVPDGFRRAEHPHGVSSLMYALASILSLSIGREGDSPPTAVLSCFGLSPLYGSTDDQTRKIRMNDGSGMLVADCFVEDRLWLLPPAGVAVLVLFNRNHNHVAKNLLLRSGGRWKDPAQFPTADLGGQDDTIFRMACSINRLTFRNAIAEDFMKGVMGLLSADPSSNLNVIDDGQYSTPRKNPFAGSSFLYHWSSLVSDNDSTRLEAAFSRFLALTGATSETATPRQFEDALVSGDRLDPNPCTRSYESHSLKRDLAGRFSDDVLAEALRHSTETLAGAPGCRQVPRWCRVLEVQRLEAARKQCSCTLNEYRRFLGLKPLISFDDWNSNKEVAAAAKALYGQIDDLELYPGLIGEAVFPDGFGFGYTMTYGLLVDLVFRIRNDPLSGEAKETNLTKWGIQEILLDRNNGASGAVLPKLLRRHLPRHYQFNNVYGLFPFGVPKHTSELLKQRRVDISLYSFGTPNPPVSHQLSSKHSISEVLNHPELFSTPYEERFKRITDGYGYFLGFDDEKLHDQDQMMTLYSLLPDSGIKYQYGANFRELTKDAIRRARVKQGTPTFSDRQTIDITRDVINTVCTRWVCETLCDYRPIDLREQTKGRGDVVAKEDPNMTVDEMHKAFSLLHSYVFRNVVPENGWTVRQQAVQASEKLTKHIKSKIPMPKWLQPNTYTSNLSQTSEDLRGYFLRVSQEFGKGKSIPVLTAQTFLERAVQASRSIPLGQEIHDLNRFKAIREKAGAGISDLQKRVDKQDRELEVARIVANVLGLAVVTSVNFSQMCAQAVDFYMSDERSKERFKITELAKKQPSSLKEAEEVNKEIMGYIREAQRIGQPLGIWRKATQNCNISQPDKLPAIPVRKGDLVYISFTELHRDPKLYESPELVKHCRGEHPMKGLGFHKCPATLFIDSTMPEIFKAIFQLQKLRRHPGPYGQFVRVKMDNALPTDPPAFLNSDGEMTFYPENLILEYDPSPEDLAPTAVEKLQKEWTFEKRAKKVKALKERIDRVLTIGSVLLILWYLFKIIIFVLAFFPRSRRKAFVAVSMADVQVQKIECPEPHESWHPWEVTAMPAGEQFPEPLEYTSDIPTAHRLSVYDIDKKDVRFGIYVDDVLRGLSFDFELDLEEDCGENLGLCAQKGFSAGLVVVPPGEHTVSIRWTGNEFKKGDKNDTKEPDLGPDKSRRLYWARESCGPA